MKLYISGVLLFTFILSGCAKDHSLAPPAESVKVTVVVKVPEGLIPKKVEVMYRSGTCKRARYGGSGQRVEVDGFHGVDKQLEREGESDLYLVSLPKDGGGKCKWNLSNISFGVAYPAINYFGDGVKYGAGGGIVVMFDDNRASRSTGYPIEVPGDLEIKKDYYPRLTERYLGGYRKTINLLGEGDIYVMYKAPHARTIYFEPVLHSNYLVRSVGPKENKVDMGSVITYPDGSIQASAPWGPDFRKMQAIRLKAEGKQ